MAGGDWRDLRTPALVADLDIAERNIEAMARRARELGVALRPHVKAHKCVELARLQIAAGAAGVLAATVAEATAMVDGGIEDVVIANQVVDERRLAAVAEAAGRARLALFVDDPGNLEAVAAAARRAGSEIGVYVDADTGMERAGARRHEEAAALAAAAAELDGVRLQGISGYEGHCGGIADRAARERCAGRAMESLAGFVAALRERGLQPATISAAGTGTYEASCRAGVLTEIQPGSYALMDCFHATLAPQFEIALAVVGTVVSRHGSQGVLDTGHKAVSAHHAAPAALAKGITVEYVDEEHLGFLAEPGLAPLGSKLKVAPGYGPLTVNLHDRIHVLRGEEVVGEWRVLARH